jgi:carbon storage regulator
MEVPMLVLTRKSQEAVVIGIADQFEQMLKVTVLEICGGKVKLGFEAAADVLVHRWEIWQRIRASGLPDSPREGAAPIG